jgi:hypothetical protein
MSAISVDDSIRVTSGARDVGDCRMEETTGADLAITRITIAVINFVLTC